MEARLSFIGGVVLLPLLIFAACSDTSGPAGTTAGTNGAGGSGGGDTGGSVGGSSGSSGSAAGGASGGVGGNAGSAGTAGSAGRDSGSNDDGASPEAGPCSGPRGLLSVADSLVNIIVNVEPRTFYLHVPSSYTGLTPVPLLLDFHGLGGSGSEQASGSGYRAASEKDGAIYVAPYGRDQAWNVGPCCTTSRFINDVSFAKTIVARLKRDGCIDEKRVYAAGTSMGGGMAHYLACHAADVFAAVAPNAFDLLEENAPTCVPAVPITEISFRGTADSLVPYAGGESMSPNGVATIHFLGAVGTFEKWAALDGCTGTPEKGKYHAYCDSHTQCAGGAEVTLCTIPNGGHTTSDGNIDIADVGWTMLKRHALP